MLRAETSENGDYDGDDFSEYRKSLRTYGGDNIITSPSIPYSSSLIKQNSRINQAHATGDFRTYSHENPKDINRDYVIDET